MSARPVIRQLAQLDDYASLATNHAHAASVITSGVFPIGRLATGTPDGTKFVRDDGTLVTPPAADLSTAPILAPATAARNTIQASTNVPVLTQKAPAATGATNYTSGSYVDRSGNEWARFVLPANPLANRDTVGGSIARLEFPHTGTGQGPLAITVANAIFNAPDPIIAIGYNWQPGGVGIAPAKTAAAWVVEGNYDFVTKTISEWYTEWYPPSGGGSAIRPLFMSIDHGGATFEDKLEEFQMRASLWNFMGAIGDTEQSMFRLSAGELLVEPVSSRNSVLKIRASASGSRESELHLGSTGNDGTFRIVTVGTQQAQFIVGTAARDACRIFSVGSGVAFSMGGSDNSAALTVITTPNTGTKTFVARAIASQSVSIIEAQNSASAVLFAVSQTGTVTIGPIASANSLFRMKAPASQESQVLLGSAGTDDTFQINTVGVDQAAFNVGSSTQTAARVYRVASGTAWCLGGNDNAAALTVITTPNTGTKTIVGRAIASQSVPIFEAQSSASAALWSIGPAGHETFSEGANIIFGTTTGTKIGTATTQKLGFFNATPVVQPTAVADVSGGAIIDIEGRATTNAILARLRALGVFAT